MFLGARSRLSRYSLNKVIIGLALLTLNLNFLLGYKI
jgi:hypothetical protein